MSQYNRRNNATWHNDEDFGLAQETILFPIVKDFFGSNTLKQHHDRYYWSDYVDTSKDGCEVGYEVKTRECYSTNSKLQNEGPFINTNKICMNEFIIFNFWDKVYYYKVEADEVKQFRRTMFKRETRACGHENKSEDVTYIPFSKLHLLHEYKVEREHNPQSAVKSNTDGAEQRRGRCLIDVSTL
jgi:hypothetical protein